MSVRSVWIRSGSSLSSAARDREIPVRSGRSDRRAEVIDREQWLGAEAEAVPEQGEASYLHSRVRRQPRGELDVSERDSPDCKAAGPRRVCRPLKHVREVPAVRIPPSGDAPTLHDELVESRAGAPEAAGVVGDPDPLDIGKAPGSMEQTDVLKHEAMDPVAANPPDLEPVAGGQRHEAGQPPYHPGGDRRKLKQRKDRDDGHEKPRSTHAAAA